MYIYTHTGIVKLSETMQRPKNRRLYRGLSGLTMPDCFWKEDAKGWKGAVEVAFMSCTLKRQVVLQYIDLPQCFIIKT